MARAVGIDLGTTNSVVAVLENGEPRVLTNAEGGRTTPSVVAFAKDGSVLVGDVARRQAVTNTARTVKSVKRRVGTGWTLEVDESSYTAPQVLALVLRKLKGDVETYLGEPVDEAVITVPAYFSDAQRQSIKDAGEIAGLAVRRIVNEPTAAALAYGLDAGEDELVLVFDLGGGTFDVSLLGVERDTDEEFSTVQVIATSGDNLLGGDDFDDRLASHLAERFAAGHGVDLSGDVVAQSRLAEAAEAAKRTLSTSTSATVSLPYLSATVDGTPLHLETVVTRGEFQQLTADLVERCRGPFEQVLADAGIEVGDIDHVVLVGGSTRMPAIVDLVTGITGTEPHRGVNPDEVVACGAALQAGVLTGERTDVLLIDVTPLTLGIETRGGLMSPVIERNTAIPVRRTRVFTTGADNQFSVGIRVCQGERDMASDNMLLGTFTLTGIAPARRGVPQIEVTFDIDANGLVSVTARDVATGAEQHTTVTGSSALTREEIEAMTAQAAAHAETDAARRELAEARNDAEALVHRIREFLDGNPAAVGVDRAHTDLARLTELLRNPEATARDISVAADRLIVSAHAVAEALYAHPRTEPAFTAEEDPFTVAAAKTSGPADPPGDAEPAAAIEPGAPADDADPRFADDDLEDFWSSL